jgi:hypothetical protein
MLLSDQARQILARLQKVEEIRNSVQEAQDLNQLREELNDRATRVRELVDRAVVLRQEQIPLSSVGEITRTKQSVSEIAARFSEVSSTTTLKKGKRWTKLLVELDGVESSVRAGQLEDWKTFHTNRLFAGPPPEQVKARLAMTPGNTKALIRYTELFRKFAAQRTSVPVSREAVTQIRECSDALADIKFDENVPAEVAKFFEATASSDGASLELLTDPVVKWLRANGLLQTYVVRARIY